MFPSISQFPKPPTNPDGFKTLREWADAVRSIHFQRKGLRRCQPFLIIRRELVHHHNSGCVKHVPNQEVRTTFYIGVRSQQKPAVQYVERKGEVGLEVRADRYIVLPEPTKGETLAIHSGPFVLKCDYFDCTPILRPFRAGHGEEVVAFSVAAGVDAMTELLVAESERSRQSELQLWYIRALHALSLAGALWGKTLLLQAEIEYHLISELIDRHQYYLKSESELGFDPNRLLPRVYHLLALAKEVGTTRDWEWLKIAGVEYQPARLVANLEEFYPTRNGS